MPRAVWGARDRFWGTDPDVELSVWDLFLSTTSTAFAGVDIEWKDGGDPSGYGFGATADTALGRIRVQPAGEITGVRASYPGRDVVIKARRLIARGNLADFRDGLTTLGPELANAGAMPFLTTEDLADWRTVVTQAAAGRPFTTRVYKTAGEVDLDELLKHDCRLIGVYPVLDADGKIALRQLRIPTASSAASFEVDASNTLVDDQPPGWERNAVYGSINLVKIRTFYDVIEEKHTGQTYVINDITAQSVRKSPKELEIAPLSSESIRDSRVWSADYATEVSRPVLSIFGRPYSIVKVRVPYTLLTTALCGTIGRITSHRIPDPVVGTRGVTQKAGLVIGREWDLTTEQGTLTLLVADAPLAGYAPSVFVSSNTLVLGTTYDLVVTFNDPSGASMAPAGAVLSDLYDVGFRLELIEWDSTSQTPQACVIDAIDDGTSTFRVTFGSAPTFTGTRYLRLRSYDSSTVPEAQRRFAHFADADNQLDRGTDFDPAREYAG
jgi:hypothetical protein